MNKRWFLLIPVVAAFLSLALFAGACGDEDGGDTPEPTQEATQPSTEEQTPSATDDGTPSEGATIDIVMDDTSITATPASASPGDVTFEISNDGTIAHEFIIVKTELAVDALPYNADEFIVDESVLDVIGEVEEDELPAGATGTLTEDLDAGSYVLFCNVATHYELGMTTAFTVE